MGAPRAKQNANSNVRCLRWGTREANVQSQQLLALNGGRSVAFDIRDEGLSGHTQDVAKPALLTQRAASPACRDANSFA
jgi:hypothetical protein